MSELQIDLPVIYLAGPMSGLPDYNYPAFNAAEVDLRLLGYDVLNPAGSEDFNLTGTTRSWSWYMRHALKALLDADGIALLPGWESSTGVALEATVARALDMEIKTLQQWCSGPS